MKKLVLGLYGICCVFLITEKAWCGFVSNEELKKERTWDSVQVKTALLSANMSSNSVVTLESLANCSGNIVTRFIVPDKVESVIEKGKEIYTIIDGVDSGDYDCKKYEDVVVGILEDLLKTKKGKFSFQQASQICNKWLPYSKSPDKTTYISGRNISFMRGCKSFMYNLVATAEQAVITKNNNKMVVTCENIVRNSSEVTMPALCIGKCSLVGNDVVTVKYKVGKDIHSINVEVDDFCDSEINKKAQSAFNNIKNLFTKEKQQTYSYLVTEFDTKDISDLSEQERQKYLE